MVAGFLIFEQLAYALFVAEPGSFLRHIYLVSAGLMLIFFSVSLHYRRHGVEKVRLPHRLYELGLGVTGMAVALIRILFLESDVFRIPTIYIAVIYGVAVIFLFSYSQSLVLYSLLTAAGIILVPRFHVSIRSSSYIADMVSNGILAWMVSAVNYRSFLKDYQKNRLIQAQNRELEELSTRDSLTQLYNRRKIDKVLQDALAEAERYRKDFSVILLDIDFFKRINDRYGHDVGDAVLLGFAGILAAEVRETDVVGRWGGEEFLIFCPEINLEQAESLAHRIRSKIAGTTFDYGIGITASMGVASYREADTLKDLLRTADLRLYRAKEKGRDRVIAEG